jgi:hypothetical protein
MGCITLYNSEYHCDRFIELCRDGKTIAQIQAEFGISKQTFYDWKERNPDFKAAVEVGIVHAQAYAEKTLDEIAQGKIEGNAAAQIFKMKVQFKDDYQDTKYIKTDNNFTFQNLPDEQLNRLIQSKMGLLTAEERAQFLPHIEAVIEGELVEESLPEKIADDDSEG